MSPPLDISLQINDITKSMQNNIEFARLFYIKDLF